MSKLRQEEPREPLLKHLSVEYLRESHPNSIDDLFKYFIDEDEVDTLVKLTNLFPEKTLIFLQYLNKDTRRESKERIQILILVLIKESIGKGCDDCFSDSWSISLAKQCDNCFLDFWSINFVRQQQPEILALLFRHCVSYGIRYLTLLGDIFPEKTSFAIKELIQKESKTALIRLVNDLVVISPKDHA